MKKWLEDNYNITVSDAEVREVLPEAKRKVELIINWEGDMDGKRRKKEYLAIVFLELVKQRRFSELCLKASRLFYSEKIKESTRNFEMLPQTNNIVS